MASSRKQHAASTEVRAWSFGRLLQIVERGKYDTCSDKIRGRSYFQTPKVPTYTYCESSEKQKIAPLQQTACMLMGTYGYGWLVGKHVAGAGPGSNRSFVFYLPTYYQIRSSAAIRGGRDEWVTTTTDRQVMICGERAQLRVRRAFKSSHQRRDRGVVVPRSPSCASVEDSKS